MRRACCILASVLAACSDPEAAPKAPPAAAQAYFQDYVVHDKAPGFRLENQIEPTRADPKRFFWRATYDREGRIVTLETFAYPMCLQSQLTLTYAKDGPVKRQGLPASDCKVAKPL